MKTLILLLVFIAGNTFAQTTGVNFKALIGTQYKTESEIDILKGFTPRGGSVITDINDPEILSGSWFVKGSTAIVFFERIDDTNNREILDVLEIKNVKSTQEIIMGLCSSGANESTEIFALVTSKNEERLKAIKAWRFNRDKGRIETLTATNVTCLGVVD